MYYECVTILSSVVTILLGSAWIALDHSPWRQRVVALTVGLLGVIEVALSGSHGPWLGDGVAKLMGGASVVVGTTVCLYALRQFEGERRARSVGAWSLMVVAGALVVASARSLLVLGIAWSATTLVVLALLHSAVGRRATCTRWARRTLIPADAILLGTLCAAAAGDVPLAVGGTTTASSWWDVSLWVAVALAAVARAGLTWRRSWVTETVGAPTPVSALLHAGFVNGGAVLLVRTGEVAPPPRAIGVSVALVGAATILALVPLIHRRADLKGQLAMSTVAQMAFMLAMVSLGWPVLGVTHAVGHGAYKAQRFLSAADATARRAENGRRVAVGSAPSTTARMAGGVALLLGAALLLLLRPLAADRVAVSVFAVAGIALWWRRTRTPLIGAGRLWGGVAVVALAYGSLATTAGGHLAAPSGGASGAPWWVPSVAVLAAAVLARRRPAAKAARTTRAQPVSLVTQEA